MKDWKYKLVTLPGHRKIPFARTMKVAQLVPAIMQHYKEVHRAEHYNGKQLPKFGCFCNTRVLYNFAPINLKVATNFELLQRERGGHSTTALTPEATAPGRCWTSKVNRSLKSSATLFWGRMPLDTASLEGGAGGTANWRCQSWSTTAKLTRLQERRGALQQPVLENVWLTKSAANTALSRSES